MFTLGSKNIAWRFMALALMAVLALPALTLAQGNGRGRGRGNDRGHRNRDVFVNGHDARDGRTDGRGPRRNGDRDDDRGRGRGRDRDRDWDRDRDRNQGTITDRNEVRRYALEAGYRQGHEAGRRDRANGTRSDYQNDHAYRDATIGYRNEFGDVNFYRQHFRQGFRQGYNDGYGNRGTRGRLGDILGGVLGYP